MRTILTACVAIVAAMGHGTSAVHMRGAAGLAPEEEVLAVDRQILEAAVRSDLAAMERLYAT